MTVDESPEGWKKNTSPFDRVWTVSSTLSHPRKVSYIADEASVAENTARTHLDRLVDMNILVTSDREGTTAYGPDPLYTRTQTLRELLEQDYDELAQLKAELQARIKEWRDEYNSDSPDELREHAADIDTVADKRDVRKTASEWELVAYRLSIVEEAIENYAPYSRYY